MLVVVVANQTQGGHHLGSDPDPGASQSGNRNHGAVMHQSPVTQDLQHTIHPTVISTLARLKHGRRCV